MVGAKAAHQEKLFAPRIVAPRRGLAGLSSVFAALDANDKEWAVQ
jgi:hypothetical protein